MDKDKFYFTQNLEIKKFTKIYELTSAMLNGLMELQ